MCGFVGFIKPGGFSYGVAKEQVIAMNSRLSHRGPDDSGLWLDSTSGIAMGHRRLAVQDTTAAGRQPMTSESANLILVFNGEIYNFEELRARVYRASGFLARGRSDTEVFLASLEVFGVEKTLKSVSGMFAFALWDRRAQKLTLGRDRFGEKPIYYGWHKDHFFFGSEVSAIRIHPEFTREISNRAVESYFRFGHIPTHQCIWKGIYKLTPGTFLVLEHSHQNSRVLPSPTVYWSVVTDALIPGRLSPFRGTIAEANEVIESLLSVSIKRQMVSDRSVGVFMSGGVDSSTVACLAGADSTIKTFSLGFHESSYNELPYARAFAKSLNSCHFEHTVDEREVLNTVKLLANVFDEPFADPSAIPTIILSQFAKQHISVALSGDGGDEVFGGYLHHIGRGKRLRWLMLNSSYLVRRILGCSLVGVANSIPPLTNFGLFSRPDSLAARVRRIGSRLVENKTLFEIYLDHNQTHLDLSFLSKIDKPLFQAGFSNTPLDELVDIREKMMLWDTNYWLPDQMLTKVDRSTMAAGIEARAPLLDHELFEFAWRLPFHYKVASGVGKLPLKNILYKKHPEFDFNRPKSGFTPPLSNWITGVLKEWCIDMLDNPNSAVGMEVDRAEIKTLLRPLKTGQLSNSTLLWRLALYEAWSNENKLH